jgi:hypothetical protein
VVRGWLLVAVREVVAAHAAPIIAAHRAFPSLPLYVPWVACAWVTAGGAAGHGLVRKWKRHADVPPARSFTLALAQVRLVPFSVEAVVLVNKQTSEIVHEPHCGLNRSAKFETQRLVRNSLKTAIGGTFLRVSRALSQSTRLPSWGGRIRTSRWRIGNRMLSPVREKPQNLFPLKLISNSKRSNLENRTESVKSRASEKNGPFGE